MVHKSNARNQIKFTNKRGDAKNVPFSSSYNDTESDTTKKFNSFDVRNVFLRFHDLSEIRYANFIQGHPHW